MLFHLATVLVQAGALMLIVGAIHSLRDWRRLLASLITHRLAPYRLARLLARFGPIAQACAGVSVLLAVAGSLGPEYFALGALVALGSVYGLMCAYLVALLAVRGQSDCNCFGTSQKVNAFSVLRTGLPAACAIALTLDTAKLPDRPNGPGLLLSVLVAAALMWAPSLHRTRASTRLG